jgi:hypothetical protein
MKECRTRADVVLAMHTILINRFAANDDVAHTVIFVFIKKYSWLRMVAGVRFEPTTFRL